MPRKRNTKAHPRGSVLNIALLLAIAAAPLAAAPPVAPPPASPTTVNGKLDLIGPYPVLRVWGSPAEMGFAHGYLLGERYLATTAEFYANPPGDKPITQEQIAALLKFVDMPTSARDEIQGIFNGIVAAAGKIPLVQGQDRALTPDDLMFTNAFDLLRAFGCSGFTVWGEKAGDAGVITARNFDFFLTGPAASKGQMILVRRPDGKNQVATVTWPGCIGAYTGVNERGVVAFVHDGTGPRIRRPRQKNTPVGIILKDLLETARPLGAQARAKSMLQTTAPYPFSYMVRVVTPRLPGAGEKPTRVFRIDGSGLSENPLGSLSCITTNHYLDAAFAPPDGASDWSIKRYQTLARRLDARITDQAAWQALRDVSSGHPQGGTLHSVIVYPERRVLDLALARWDEKVIPATHVRPTRITFDQLFKEHE